MKPSIYKTIAFTAVILTTVILIVVMTTNNSKQDNFKMSIPEPSSDEITLRKIITSVVEDTNLNDEYKARAKATLYNIVKRVERVSSRTMKNKGKGMTPSKQAEIILQQNRDIIDKSNGKIKKVVVIGDKRYIIGAKNKLLDMRKIQVETYKYEGQEGNWDVSISVGEELPAPGEEYSCRGQEGPNFMCPSNKPNCCYGPTNPPIGICKEECEKDFDTFVTVYLPSLLSTLGVAIITAWATGVLVGGGFLLIGIALVVIAAVLLILQALEKTDTSFEDIWNIIKTAIASLFNSAKIVRPYDEDRLLSDRIPILDDASKAIVIGNDEDVDNIVADDMPGSTGIQGSDAYMSVKDVASRGISKVILELTLLPGVFDRNIAKPCDPRRDCNDLSRRQNESTQEHSRRLICCLSTSNRTIPSVVINLPEPEAPNQLPPPSTEDNLLCRQQCFNGYPGTVCVDRETGETVSESWSNSQNVAECCRNECIDDTWHTVCPPHPGIDSGTSCDQRPPKL